MTLSAPPRAHLIDGKARAAALREAVAAEVGALHAATGVRPGLAVVLVGEDPASLVYVRNKGHSTEAAGMASTIVRLPASTSQDQLEAEIHRLNTDPAIHGVLVQLPLPGSLDSARAVAAIDPDKDVDGLTVINAGRLASGLPGLVPCTPQGCMILLRDALASLAGRHALVLGRSNLMGKPMAQLLLQADCTVTIAHSKSQDLPELCRQADIVVAAVGRPEMVRGDWIKPGSIVIDVGVNRVPARDPARAAEGGTRLTGDVAFDEACRVAGAITPVPGGVGPMTIACLLRNTLIAAQRRTGALP